MKGLMKNPEILHFVKIRFSRSHDGAGDMISLDSRFPVRSLLNTRQLFEFSLKWLKLHYSGIRSTLIQQAAALLNVPAWWLKY